MLDADGRARQPRKGSLLHRFEQHGERNTMEALLLAALGVFKQLAHYQ